MISKVISLKKSGAAHSGFGAVVAYIGRDGEDARAKGLASLDAAACDVLNLEADCGTPEDRQDIAAAMNATAMLSSRMRSNPAYHFSVSWVEGEHPTRGQCEKTVTHFVRGLGMAECETFWVIHRDTDNDHIHVVVNTVHPEKGTVVGPPRFDYRVLSKLAREVEQEQGWQRDAGYYMIVEPEPGEARIMKKRRPSGLDYGTKRTHNGLRFQRVRRAPNTISARTPSRHGL